MDAGSVEQVGEHGEQAGADEQHQAPRRAVMLAHAVDHVGLAGGQRRDERRQVARIVFEVGVLDYHELTGRGRQRRPDRRPFPAITPVPQQLHAGGSGQLAQYRIGAVGGAVVHHDDLHGQRHLLHISNHLFDRARFVEHRNDDGEHPLRGLRPRALCGYVHPRHYVTAAILP